MKRGQMKLSFGMIFSIILIIIFVAFAFYAIRVFVNIGDSASSGKLGSDVQRDIDKIWKNSQSKQEFEYFLPRGVEYLCFIDFAKRGRGDSRNLYDDLEFISDGNGNLVLYPSEDVDFSYFDLEHLNITETTLFENPLCFKDSFNVGKVGVTFEKNFSDISVTAINQNEE